MDDKRSKVFNAHQGKFGSQWLNVVPCKNLGLKLDDHRLRISIGLRLGANICVAHTGHCGKRVERDGLHSLSCTKSAGRFSRHATINLFRCQFCPSLRSISLDLVPRTSQKNWTQPVYVKTAQDLISRMDDKRSKVFNAHQGKFGSQWLNVVPCKNLGLKLDDHRLRISIGLRLGANICVAHTGHCGKRVERDDLHSLSCTKSAGRFSRHATLNSLIKQTLESLDLPSMLEPRGLYRTDGKRADGVTMIPWEMGKQLVWDVTVVDALAPSRLNQGSLCNPGTTATEAEARKIEKYR